ncbi:MAG: PqiC family protein, partial [Janthinobacterium lividum]
GRVMAEDLAQRLPGTQVTTAQGVISAHPDLLVELQVDRFDSGHDNTLTLSAQVSVLRASDRAALATRSFRLTAANPPSNTAELVARMSLLLGQLADRAAAMVTGGATS